MEYQAWVPERDTAEGGQKGAFPIVPPREDPSLMAFSSLVSSSNPW